MRIYYQTWLLEFNYQTGQRRKGKTIITQNVVNSSKKEKKKNRSIANHFNSHAYKRHAFE